jgi:3-methyladenine DNA glycosylase AlkD
MIVDEIFQCIEMFENPANLAGMKRMGIFTDKIFGLTTPEIKRIAKEVKKQTTKRHELAQELWKTGIFEGRAIACLIDEPEKVTGEQMDAWAADFDNWATCDAACCYLFCRTGPAYEKAFSWAEREEEFVKRAAFSLMAYLAVHDKKAPDERIARFFPVIESKSDDERNFVKKAVNWALRQIGKRNLALNKLAIETGEKIKTRNTKAARWIAADALRELRSAQVQERLRRTDC